MVEVLQVKPVPLSGRNLVNKFIKPILKQYKINTEIFNKELSNISEESYIIIHLIPHKYDLDKIIDIKLVNKLRKIITYNIMKYILDRLHIEYDQFECVCVANKNENLFHNTILEENAYSNIKRVFLMKYFTLEMEKKQSLQWYFIVKKNGIKHIYFYSMFDENRKHLYYDGNVYPSNKIDDMLVNILNHNDKIDDITIEYNYYYDDCNKTILYLSGEKIQ